MHTITSKSGKTITFRPPAPDDTKIMLEYINKLSKEDIYLDANPNDLFTYKQEEEYLKNVKKKLWTNKPFIL